MGIINVLDKHTANLIAAGEVVERPSSAIKELLENSADAGATQITVEIKNGGSTYIRVSDNGSGISAEDVPVCILRHATSKIRTKTDLEAISTLGFRGEALAAIAAVTRLRIMTKRREDKAGTYFAADFGEKTEISETGCPDGTTIIAENLFENVPARRKFLRKDMTEAKAVGAAIEKFALSKPSVAVTFISDGGIKLKTPGDGSLKSAIYACLGRDFTDHMLPVNYSLGDVEVTGYIGKPQIARPNRNLQNFFINERYIKSGTMTAGLEEGFKSFCPIGKFPACVLFVKLDFRLVDINIHPAKLEVKFSNERPVFEAVMYAVRNSLSRGMASFAPGDEESYSRYTPPSAKRTPDELTKQNEDVVINNSESSTNIFNAATGKEPEIISDKGKISVPNPESIQRIYGKTTNGLPNERNFDYSVPDYVRQSAELADSFEKKQTPKAPILQADNSPASSNTAEHGTDKQSTEIPREAPEKDNFAKEAIVKEVKNHSPEEVSLFQSMPREATKMPEAPFRESTDSDMSNELLSRVKRGVTVIGEAFNSYLLAERDNVLYLIDKHAAHERIIYESLKKGKKEGGSQLLLMPISVNLTADEAIAITENGEYLENIGFVFEEFGTNTYLIRGTPAEIETESAAETFVYLTGQIAKSGGKAIGDIFDRALYTAACKAAVKAGTKTSKLSSTMIADILFSDEAVLYCPHGRPVILEFTKSKLDKMFSRT